MLKISTIKAFRPKQFFYIFLFLVLSLGTGIVQTATAQQTGPVLRINTGSLSEASGGGETFIGDTYFSEDSSFGAESPNSIDGTENDVLYQTERISNSDLDPFGYTIPLDNGTYDVTLHFAETAFQSTGQRVFDVVVENITELDNYDILNNVAMNTAVKENFSVDVSDGELNIEFISIVERAKISGIEIEGAVTPVTIPFALNAGGAEYESTDYTWIEDDGSYFLNEGMAFTKEANIANTEDDDLYKAERFHPTLRFVLPGIETGVYTIELHFAETFHQAADQRLFDVSIEGVTVLPDYDIFDAAGGFSIARVETFQGISILDGILNITLDRSVGSATINAIAITEASSVANESFEGLEVPGTHKLSAAYPNPFNPQTQFSLSVASTQQVSINVFNLLGQQVKTLYTGMMPAQQEHSFSFEAASLPSGIYLIQARGEHFLETQQVILLK